MGFTKNSEKLPGKKKKEKEKKRKHHLKEITRLSGIWRCDLNIVQVSFTSVEP